MRRARRIGGAFFAALSLACAAGTAAAEPYTMHVDFFGEEALVDRDAGRAIEEIVRGGVVQFGTLANGGDHAARSLLYDYGVVRDDDSLRMMMPLLCRANAHICRKSWTGRVCKDARCLALKSIAEPRRHPPAECGAQAASGRSTRLPRHVLCAPAMTVSVNYVSTPRPEDYDARQLAGLRRQLGGCEPQPDRGCVPREVDRTLVANGELMMRRVRLSVPIGDAAARNRFDAWYDAFRKKSLATASDLRPPRLRLRATAGGVLAPQEEVALVADGPSDLVCSNGECLNPRAYEVMNGKNFLAEREDLAKSASWILAIEKREMMIGSPEEGYDVHCALRPDASRNVRDGTRVPGPRAATPVTSVNIDCKSSVWKEDAANLPKSGSELFRYANHALAVSGILSADMDHGNNVKAKGALPGVKVVALTPQQPGSDGVDGAQDVQTEGLSGKVTGPDEPAGFAGNYDTVTERGWPRIVNVSQAALLWKYEAANKVFLNNRLFYKLDQSDLLIVASAGNWPSDPEIGLEAISNGKPANGSPYQPLYQSSRTLVDDYSKGRIGKDNCAIWPACLSVQPAKHPDMPAQDFSRWLISVVGLSADGTAPIVSRPNDSSTDASKRCEDEGVCGFHGPAFDVAAVGEAVAPAVTRVARDSTAYPWRSKEFGYKLSRGSSFAAPFVSALGDALFAKAQDQSRQTWGLGENYETAPACNAVRNQTPNLLKQDEQTVFGAIKDHLVKNDRARLVRERILASADFTRWPENLNAVRAEETSEVGHPSAVTTELVPRYAQYGRINFDHAIDFENDCLMIGVADRKCSANTAAYRGPPNAQNPLFSNSQDGNMLPSALLFSGGTISHLPEDELSKERRETSRHEELEGDLSSNNRLLIPVADIRRLERLHPKGVTEPIFRVVFVDRFDPNQPFALRHIVGTKIAASNNTTDKGKVGTYRLFDGLPLADNIGNLTRELKPVELEDFLSAWPVECGRIYRREDSGG